MGALAYIRLVGCAAGTLVHLFFAVLVAGYRRPRAFERVLFFLALSLFLFYAGVLLELNAEIYYPVPPAGTVQFAVVLAALGLGFLPPLLVHLHVAYNSALRQAHTAVAPKMLIAAAYVPILYFAWFQFPRLLENPSLKFLEPGTRLDFYYGLWLSGALVVAVVFNLRFGSSSPDRVGRRLHRVLAVCFGVAAALVAYTYVAGGPRDAAWSAGFTTAVMLVALLPSSLLGYHVLRFNFLQIGAQRNLVYAVSAAFLALLYLSVVRRAERWLEPILPPEATSAVLLFVLVIFFEPLQRRVSRALRRSLQAQVDRLQRLMAEFHEEARRGDLRSLAQMIEIRIRDAFRLEQVRLLWLVASSGEPEPDQGADGRWQRFALRKDREIIGALEVRSYGAGLSGETHAAMAFLAEQLPATLDLCWLIEEKLNLERELAQRERMALVGQMAASISHNLKNPLGSMKTVLQVQLENPELPESVRGDCALVIGEIDRLSAKLRQLLSYSQPAVRAVGASDRVAARPVIEQQVTLLRREAERRGVRLDFESAGGEAPVRASEEVLSDIVSNLVVNAIEALPRGGSVCVRLAPAGDAVRLEVTDDGPGVSPEVREKMFQPFFTTKASGTGLGLAIVARRVGELGGRIRWESPVRDGHGTRFTVELPPADKE